MPPFRTVVVSVNVDVTVLAPGVNVAGEKAPVESGGRFEAVNVIRFGNPPVPGATWITAVMSWPATAG
jgi:hypothetical protein